MVTGESDIRVESMQVWRNALPMRSFEHAAASRHLAEAIFVKLTLSDGRVGWGETLPREYVTGETMESVASSLQNVFWEAVTSVSAADVLADANALPLRGPDGKRVNAARCAVEMALLDALARPDGSVWELLAEGPVARAPRIRSRVTGVLGSADPGKTARRLRLMWWYGLRNFKLKLGLGDDADAANLHVVHRRLGVPIAAGRATLRVDANGAWKPDEAVDQSEKLAHYGVNVIEQPIYGSAGDLLDLAGRSSLPLIADESLLDEADADALAEVGQRVWWNVRISKNGGPVLAARLMRKAAEAGTQAGLGCMVGESSLLSACQRQVLMATGGEAFFVEGNYGRFLLGGDVVTGRSLRFGYGGKLKALYGKGMGVDVDEGALAGGATLVAELER